MATIAVPTIGGVQRGLTNYVYGVVAGAAFKMISQITGSGMIGGAVASAGASALVKGPAGDAISAMAGFAAGQTLNLGGGLGGILGGSAKAPAGDDDEI